MIIYVKGDYFNSHAQVVTYTVNTEGVWEKDWLLSLRRNIASIKPMN